MSNEGTPRPRSEQGLEPGQTIPVRPRAEGGAPAEVVQGVTVGHTGETVATVETVQTVETATTIPVRPSTEPPPEEPAVSVRVEPRYDETMAHAASPAEGAILALFRTPDTAADAYEALRKAEFPRGSLNILTDTPYPEGAFGEEKEPQRVHIFSFMGAACGFVVGLFLTIATQLSYPLVTGGKPIISVPPMINILYEGSMLGAIIFTFFGIVRESRLPEFRPLLYDERISEGYIGILVGKLGGRFDEVVRIFRETGAVDILWREAGHEDE